MRKTGIGLLAIVSAALVVGCGADVDKPSEVFRGEADLSGAVSGPASLTPGTIGEWTFTVRNAGPQPATDVQVEPAVFLFAPPGRGIITAATRWTCEATGGSCGAASGQGAPSNTVSLENGGEAVITVRAPLAYGALPGVDFEARISVGEDAQWEDPNPDDNVASAPAAVGDRPALADFSDEIIYWAFTDRFANGDPANDNADGTRQGDTADPSSHIAWHGGDFAGIEQKIGEGYFQAMGFTAIWISPVIYQVPGLDNGNAAYHGYWPELTLDIEPHFGTIDELRSLVETAHANGLKVIVDFVANHVGYDAAVIQTNRDWVRLGSECQNPDTDLERACLAGLPDLKQEIPEVAAFVSEQIQNLVAATGLDGFRWDAQRFVNNDFWFEAFAPGAPADRSVVWSVGENTEGPERQAYWLDTIGTPSSLDFPVYEGFIGAVGGFSDSLTRALASDSLYSDPGRMATFLDNHDQTRAVSRMIDARGYDRGAALELLEAGLAFLYANRGIPVVYYGTEIGMEGIDDFNFPDNSNRKSMDFTAVTTPTQPVLTVTPNTGATCGVADAGLDNTAAYGAEFFARGGFNDWGAPAEAKFVNLGDDLYVAEFQVTAGDYEFKLASEDWSTVDFSTDGRAVVVGEPTRFQPGAGTANARISIPADGCYTFSLETDPLGPLPSRIAALAQARQAYPALREGTQTVLADFSQQCAVPPSWPPATLPGPLFVRGGFNDWGNPEPPPAESAFIRTELDTFEAEFEIAAGSYEYKIATNGWSDEWTVEGQATPLGTAVNLIPGGGQPNGQIVIPADGCYNFTLDASDVDNPVLTASADTDGTCAPQSNDPDAVAFGAPVYVRGSFNGWAEPAVEGDRFAETGPGTLTARVGLTPGEPISYKIASADYGVERVVLGGPTLLDTSQLIGLPSGNGTLTVEEAGCYEWTIDVTDPEVAYLTVSKSADGSDVFALRRDLEGAASVVLVMNMGDGPADLGSLGGIPVAGLADGPAVELTGAANDLAIAGGVLTGTVPARTAYLVSDR